MLQTSQIHRIAVGHDAWSPSRPRRRPWRIPNKPETCRCSQVEKPPRLEGAAQDAKDRNSAFVSQWKTQPVAMMLAGAMMVAMPLEAHAAATTPFPCENVAEYYSTVKDLKGRALKDRLHEVIANHKIYTYEQVWDALKILDAADEINPDKSPDVIGIYSQRRMPKSMAGKPEGWNREHLWPRSIGLRKEGGEFTDLHHLRPADWNVNAARGNKAFDACTPGTLRCVSPGHPEASSDTAADDDSWQPPAVARGDIARALLYMAVAYEAPEPGAIDLELDEFVDRETGRMGVLSTLLKWHEIDPPSASERLRNSRVCSLYQHNRNPFVDHPEWVAIIGDEGWREKPLRAADVTAKAMDTAPPSSTIPSPATAPANSSSSASRVADLPPNVSSGELSKLVWLNEFHYDNVGKDQDEFLEVVLSSRLSPESVTVYLYNGETQEPYNRLPLKDFRAGQSANGYTLYSALVAGIQNGPPDGIAIAIQTSKDAETLVQFLSYEGKFRGASGVAKGVLSQDIGVEQDNSTPLKSSLGLVGKGTAPAEFRWEKFDGKASMGSFNPGQTVSK
eukprot:jgi/Mesvir1/29664/Mv21505-RA.1